MLRSTVEFDQWQQVERGYPHVPRKPGLFIVADLPEKQYPKRDSCTE